MTVKWMFIFFYACLGRFSLAQTPLIDIPITISDNSGASQELRFGIAATATDSLDESLGEQELPPFPPAGIFEARFVGEDISLPQLGLGTYRDYRSGDINFSGSQTHELRYQVGTGTAITIRWNLPACVTGHLQDFFGGIVINKDMNGLDSLVVDNPGVVSKLAMTIFYRQILPAPTLIFPDSNATEIATDTVLVWNAAGCADSYGMQISTDSNFTSLIVEESGLLDTTYHVTGLQDNTTYFWRVNAGFGENVSDWSEVWQFKTAMTTAVEQGMQNIPMQFTLEQNYPNPFNNSTEIRYVLPKAMKVTLEVYNILGQRVAVLLDGKMAKGRHSVKFNHREWQSGFYFYRLQAEGFVQMKKMIMLK